MRPFHLLRIFVVGAIAITVLLLATIKRVVPEASACGGFFSRTASRPSLALERVLLIFDEAQSREHLIRQVTFRAGNETFGFVVPTPSRPEVASVKRAPFDALQTSYPFARPKYDGVPGGRGKGQGFGSGHGRLGVRVLEKTKVGSFTAFVLAADDEEALSSWLKDNGLKSAPEAKRWLAHFVMMKFYFVAMRYEPPNKEDSKADGKTKASDQGKVPSSGVVRQPPVKAETVRMSFSTPVPYYPYLEPPRPIGVAKSERALELWLIARQPVVPVAVVSERGVTRWVQPMKEGAFYDGEPMRRRLAITLRGELEKLLPKGPVVMQTFQDQKSSRAGFDDVLFAPKKRRTLTAEQKTKLQSLLPILDPSLLDR